MPPPAEAICSPRCDYAFGSFRLFKESRHLLDGDAPVRLGGRAFDLLVALLERAGEVVSRRELEGRVWPSSIVEETSLRVHVSALRRALHDGNAGMRYIENVPGRGYCFVGAVLRDEASASLPAPVPPLKGRPRHRTGRMIGRAEALALLNERLQTHRLVTIAGPGGIGKTTLALALADDCAARHRHGTVFVNLTPLADGALVAATVAAALELPPSPQDALGSLAHALRDMDVLIVLDNCEHVIDAAAALADRLVATTSVTLLATSREPIDVDGEWVYRLAPLGMPPANDALNSAQAMNFPAVELFVERASASGLPFVLTDDNVADVCALARQLDGLPLAVELAAARVPHLGVRELSSRIGDHLSLLFRGRRTAEPRHQTLAAMLDWSYQLLPTPEQIVLRRLSVFRGSFNLEAASGVASGDGITRDDVLELVLSLVTRSLISVAALGERAEYRLLETTRTFAMRKLREAEPVDPVFRRHALEMLAKLVAADAGREGMSRQHWLATYGGPLDDVRAALDWCFSEHGDLLVGIELMAIALPLHELAVLSEQAERIESALNHLRQLTPPRPDLELRLNLVLAWPIVEPGWRGQRTSGILSRAAQLVERMDDPTSRILALYSSWLGAFVTGDYVSAQRDAESALEIAHSVGDEAGVVMSERLLGQCLHFTGDFRSSRTFVERTLSREGYRMPPGYPSIVPRGISMRIVMTRMLWLEGQPDSAVRLAEECLAMTGEANHHAVLQTLAMAAVPLAFWRGDLDHAEDLVARLAATAHKSNSPYWGSWARSFESVLETARDTADGEWRMPVAQTINAKELDCIASVAPHWNHSVSLNRVNSGSCGWCAAEVLRKHGEHLLRLGDAQAVDAAEQAFRRAMDMAHRQGALAWELRAATSLARGWIAQGRFAEARELVAPLYGRFDQGLTTADLRAARAIVSA
jgi:predicted ATPase/DNA-binding winged helix-turn-helix (wHTH) protein